MGLSGNRGQQPGGGAPKGSPNRTRGGGAAPLSFSLSLSFLLLLLGLGKGGVQLLLGGGFPSWGRAQGGPDDLPLAPLYTGAGGTLEHTS